MSRERDQRLRYKPLALALKRKVDHLFFDGNVVSSSIKIDDDWTITLDKENHSSAKIYIIFNDKKVMMVRICLDRTSNKIPEKYVMSGRTNQRPRTSIRDIHILDKEVVVMAKLVLSLED